MRAPRRIPVLAATFSACALFLAGTLAVADDESDRKAFLEKQRVKSKELMGELERFRGDKFDREIGVEVMTTQQFKDYMNAQLEKDLPQEESDAMQKAYERMGLIPSTFNIRTGMVDMMASAAAAFYDPDKDTFYILMTGMDAGQLEPTMLHELEHALQDQLFDIGKMMKDAEASKNDDLITAIRFVVEGEANYIMTCWAAKKQQGMDLERMGPMARQIFKMQADMDKDGFLQMAKMQAEMGGGDEALKAAEGLKDVPNWLFRVLTDPYNKGQLSIFDVKQKSGWKGVNALFTNPPQSTEQMLHPEKLNGPNKDLPTAVALPALEKTLGEGWKLLHDNTLGEHALAALFEGWIKEKKKSGGNGGGNPMRALMGGGGNAEGDRAAAGWDGDRYGAYEGPDGDLALVFRSVWDSEKDANEFIAAYTKLQSKKLKGRQVKADGVEVAIEAEDGFATITRKGADVVVIEGVASLELAAALTEGAFSGEATEVTPSTPTPAPTPAPTPTPAVEEVKPGKTTKRNPKARLY